jgi:predicted HAD superfamily Cof-like phosphohydrolase
MTNEQNQVRHWMTAFGQECPTVPTIPSLDVRKLRAKLELEETLETIRKGLGLTIRLHIEQPSDGLRGWIYLDKMEDEKFDFLECGPPNLVEIADGCEDLKVVTEGTLIACGLIFNPSGVGTHPARLLDPLFDEVMRSNFSKFGADGKPIKDESGKVVKGPNFTPPNLQPIIASYSL